MEISAHVLPTTPGGYPMKEITPEELTKRLESGEDIAVIDIREPDEFEDWHIYGAENVPSYNALSRGDAAALSDQYKDRSKDTPVVAVCRMGSVSVAACQILESLGYEALNLTGGMFGWTNAWTTAPVEFDSGTVVQIRRNGKGCLSYLAGADGEGAVIDPCMDVAIYTEVASNHGLDIKHVLETHVHADHISRARELCDETGAQLHLPKNNRVNFEYSALEHGQTLSFGGLTLQILHTPGHTGESVCFELDGKVLFSGDTIFIEGLGRPDLEKGDAGATDGARMLYDSLHNHIMPMSGKVLVCPGHTSKPMGFDGTALAARLEEITPRIDLLRASKDDFVPQIVGALGQKPPNFQRVVSVNEGRMTLGLLDPLELEAGPNRCAVKNG